MKILNIFGALLMLIMLYIDITTNASFRKVVFHLFLLFGNMVCASTVDE